MKNAKNLIVAAMMVLTIATYANANNLNNNISARLEEKVKVAGVKNVLPAALPVLETPAPHAVKNVTDTNKLSAEQRAAIVELQLKSNSAK